VENPSICERHLVFSFHHHQTLMTTAVTAVYHWPA